MRKKLIISVVFLISCSAFGIYTFANKKSDQSLDNNAPKQEVIEKDKDIVLENKKEEIKQDLNKKEEIVDKNTNKENKKEEINKNKEDEKISVNENKDNLGEKIRLKESYLKKYKEKDIEVENIYKAAEEDGSITNQLVMNDLATKDYAIWDNFLNQIWKELSNTMNKNDFEKLRLEQNKWITLKKAKVEKIEKEFEGGNGAILKISSVTRAMTKERCLELINNYM